MSKQESDDSATLMGRRGFLKVVGAASAVPLAASPAMAAMSSASSAPMAMDMPAAATDPNAEPKAGYQYFNANEQQFIEAWVDTLIPHDDVGPGALELGVNVYIDRQMAGAYGKGDRLYVGGPYAEGTPQQGYQLPLTPSELVRAGIADVDTYAQSSQGDFFSSLAADKRALVLKDVEGGKITLATVPPALFFNELLNLTMEGYFGDPLYGGNKDKASWAMIGFPGANAMYADKIEPYRNKQYDFTPQGIQDL